MPVFVLIFGLGASGLATYLVQENVRVKNQLRFTEARDQITETINFRMEAYAGLLRGGAGLFAANQFVSLDQFRNFHQRLQITELYPGMQGYGYSARVPADRLADLTDMVRRQGLTNFQVWPTNSRPEYHAIVFLEPQDARNARALGFDMFTEPVRRAAMEAAANEGRVVASGKVRLVQEDPTGPSQRGFLMYMPVYLEGRVPGSLEERRQQLQGFVYAPFRAEDLLRGIFGPKTFHDLHFSIYDGRRVHPETVLFTTAGMEDVKSSVTGTNHLRVAGRPWTVVFKPSPAFGLNEGGEMLLVVPLLGLLATALLLYFTHAESRARARLEISSRQLKEHHEWLQVTFSSIGDAVITTNSSGEVRFMNPVAEQLTGWSLREAEGRLLREVFDIIHEETRQVQESPAEKVLAQGKPTTIANHTLLISKDGMERCVDDSCAPIRDARGNIVGVVLVFHEITERRSYERRITAQHAVTSVLAESPALDVAAGRLLEAIAEHLKYDHGVFWLFDLHRQVGEAYKIWHLPNLPLESFDQACLSFKPKPGEGLPGTVWASGRPGWTTDFGQETRFPRAEEAKKNGINSAVAFPIAAESEIFGVLEFFSRDPQQPDLELQHVLKGLGAQIGQFIRRKRAEQQLKESEALHRAISETAADGIVTIDENSTILTVNSAVERIFGYTREELLARNLTMLMPEPMRERHSAGLRRFIATGQRRMSWNGVELPGLRKDGLEIPLEISFGVSTKGGRYLFTGLIRDIARRKQAEQSLREAQERFSLLVRLAEDFAIIFMDMEGRISHWNPGAQRIFGYSEEEAMGENARILFTPEDREKGISEAEMTSARESGQAVDERWHIRKDGSRFFASGALISLPPDGERPGGFAKILRDITQRKKAEEAIRELNQELETRVQRRTAALQESKEQMEAFTYTVAHDLRAPLRAMQGFSQALKEDYASNLDQSAHDYLERIMSSAQRMDTLIQDLLAYSQLSRSDLHFQKVSVAEAVSNALAATGHLINESNATVETNLDSLSVKAHAATLQHALANLISNAIKFTAPDQKPVVQIRAIEQGDRVKISVQDNGIGIAPEHQDRIFRVFERLHSPHDYPGTGIGLAIVKTGIERMGGRVGLVSAAGEGSLFWVDLPRA